MTRPAVRVLLQAFDDVPDSDDWLSASERVVLDGLRFPKRRAEWRLGRWTAKRAVAEVLGHPDDDASASARIRVVAAPDGAPEVSVNGVPSELVVSISHRAGRAVCAVAPAGVRLGCDLEAIEARSRGFLTDYLTPEEVADVERAPEAGSALAATLVWSAKESALKALRSGLRADTRSVVVNADGRDAGAGAITGGWCPLSVRETASGQVFRGWWCTTDGSVLTVLADEGCDPPRMLGRGRGRAARIR